MKIIVVAHSLLPGGAERVAVNLAGQWAANGWNVSLVTLISPDSDFYVVDERVGRISLNLADGGGVAHSVITNWRRIMVLRHVIRHARPEVVLGIDTPPSVLAILASRGLPCKVIATEHTHPPQVSGGRPWKMLRRLLYASADQVVALTRESRTWLEQYCRCRNVMVVPNAVSVPIPVTGTVLAPERVMTPGRRLLLAAGRLEKEKGFENLIEAFSKIAHELHLWDLVILGDGKERDALERRVTSAGLNDRVFMPGHVGNVSDWYARADLYVMSSYREGFPMTLAEAMASGCAAVSYDCDTGPRDLIKHGENGLLVRPVGDTQELADALRSLMVEERQRERMASRASDVSASFSPAKVLANWHEVFAEAGVRLPRGQGAVALSQGNGSGWQQRNTK